MKIDNFIEYLNSSQAKKVTLELRLFNNYLKILAGKNELSDDLFINSIIGCPTNEQICRDCCLNMRCFEYIKYAIDDYCRRKECD